MQAFNDSLWVGIPFESGRGCSFDPLAPTPAVRFDLQRREDGGDSNKGGTDPFALGQEGDKDQEWYVAHEQEGPTGTMSAVGGGQAYITNTQMYNLKLNYYSVVC
jgi:hypothetical protein